MRPALTIPGRGPAIDKSDPARVLYVDDEIMLLNVTKAFLETEEEIVVDVATSAERGLEALRRVGYDVVISDYQMPIMDGLELLRIIREGENYIPFILFTGKGREEVAIEALNNGADFYLQKGGDPAVQFGELKYAVMQLAQRKRTEEAFLESERRYRELVESSNSIVLRMNQNGQISYANDFACRAFGYAKEELLGQNVLGTIVPERNDRGQDMADFLSSIIENPNDYASHIAENRRKDGTKLWVAWTNKSTQNEKGEWEVHSTGVDVTRQHLAEREKERSMSLLRATLDSTADAVLVVDLENRVQAYNRRFLETSGLDELALTASPGIPVIDRMMRLVTDPEVLSKRAAELMADPDSSSEDLIHLKDGRAYQMITHPQTINGRTVGRVWNFHDMTAVKHAEMVLAEREARLNSVFQGTTIGMVVISHDRYIKEANRAFLEMLGYTLDEIRSMRVEDITFIDDRDRDVGPLQSMARGEMRSYQVEKRYVRKDGNMVWGRTTVASIEYPHESHYFMTATIENIDEWKRTREKLDQVGSAFDTLANNITDGALFVYDRDMRFIRGMGVGLKAPYLDNGRVEGKTIYEVFPPNVVEETEPYYRKALAGISLVHETSVQGRSFLTSYWPVRDETGQIRYGVAFSQDITERKQYEVRLAKMNRSLQMISECNKAMVRAEDEKDLLDDICRTITAIGEYQLAWVGMASKGRRKIVRPVASAGEGQGFLERITASYSDTELGQGLAGTTMRTGEVFIIPNLQKDGLPAPLGDRAKRFGLRAGIGLPLMHRGKLFGVLAIYSKEWGAFGDQDEQNLLIELAMDLSYGIINLRQQVHRVRSERALARRGKQLEQLALATQKLNAILDSEAIMDTLLSSAMEVVGATSGMWGTIVDERMVYARINRFGRTEPINISLGKGEGVTGHVMETMRPYLSNDPGSDIHVISSLRDKVGFHNLAIVPILDRRGQIIGSFWMQNKPGNGFDEGDLEALSGLAAGASVALENAGMIKELRQREDALEKANRKLDLIVRVTRHDLLNQLTALTGYLEMARTKEKDERVCALMDKAARSAENIEKYLAFASEYREMGTARPAWTKVGEAVAAGVSTVNLGPISLFSDVDGLEVMADPMLEKVFHNLADDSVRHGGKVRNIWISGKEDGDDLLIVYEDDGVGIPPDKKRAIFEMTAGHHGLYMAKEILGITGMSIEESGESGMGARFEIRAPEGKHRTMPAK